jgi:hypothetical protein
MPLDRLAEFIMNLIEDLFGRHNTSPIHQPEQLPAFEAEHVLSLMFVQPLRAQHGEFAHPRNQLGGGKLIVENALREVELDSNRFLNRDISAWAAPLTNIYGESPQSLKHCQLAFEILAKAGTGNLAASRQL